MKRLGLAILSFVVAGGKRVQLLPAGPLFRARDGRPENIEGYRIDAAIAASVIARAAARETPFVIDYEHQTLFAEENGRPAPAAGWFRTIEWVEGEGLFAVDVEWTARARAMIEAGEYKFISPVFAYDRKTGAVVEMQMAALTNNPALDGMAEVAALAALKLSRSQHEQENTMPELLKKLLAAIGLQETLTEDEALAAAAALKAKADRADGHEAARRQAESELAALKAGAAGGEPDPARYVPVETMRELQAQVATLTARIAGREVDELVAGAIAEGKLLPAQEQWARGLGAKDQAALKAYLDTAQPIAALKGSQTGGKGPGTPDGALTDAERAVCKAMGLTEEQFKAGRA